MMKSLDTEQMFYYIRNALYNGRLFWRTVNLRMISASYNGMLQDAGHREDVKKSNRGLATCGGFFNGMLTGSTPGAERAGKGRPSG